MVWLYTKPVDAKQARRPPLPRKKRGVCASKTAQRAKASSFANPAREIIAPGAPATQPSPLKVQNGAVMLREGRPAGTYCSGGRREDKLNRRPLRASLEFDDNICS
jgi:hypothetical protein